MPDDITFHIYLEKCLSNLEDKLRAQSEYIEQHFELNEMAIRKAEEAMLTRLESMNEFRAQIKEERGDYATKESVDRTKEAIEERIRYLENTNAFSAGKLWMVMAAFAVIPTVLALIALFR